MPPRAPRLAPSVAHPIQVVARRTGLSPDVIRAWEKRYEVVAPVRAPNGRRLYSERDIERLQLLSQATLTGRTIGQVATLPHRELVEVARTLASDGRADASGATSLPRGQAAVAAAHVRSALQAIDRFDVVALDAVFRHAVLALPAEGYLDEVVVRVWEQVSQPVAGRSSRAPETHLALAAIRRALFRLLDIALPSFAAPAVVVTTPSGQPRELGALLCAAAAAAEGWRVLYMGPGLPAEEIAAVAVKARARATVVSVGAAPADRAIARELRRLRDLLARGTPIFVEGPGADVHAATIGDIGSLIVRDLPALRLQLRALHDTYASDGALASPRQ